MFCLHWLQVCVPRKLNTLYQCRGYPQTDSSLVKPETQVTSGTKPSCSDVNRYIIVMLNLHVSLNTKINMRLNNFPVETLVKNLVCTWDWFIWAGTVPHGPRWVSAVVTRAIWSPSVPWLVTNVLSNVTTTMCGARPGLTGESVTSTQSTWTSTAAKHARNAVIGQTARTITKVDNWMIF